jgi:hypothetical protein
LYLGIVLSLFGGVAAASDSSVPRAVDLNDPGALEGLRTSNPEHLRKVVDIVRAVDASPGPGTARWADANARNGYVSSILRTTHPPQRDFRFTLDGTTYYGRTNLGLKAAIAGALKAPRP